MIKGSRVDWMKPAMRMGVPDLELKDPRWLGSKNDWQPIGAGQPQGGGPAPGQPVGLVIALAVGSEAEILTLGVLPKFRRRGIAARLLASVADRLNGAGCPRLLLEVAEDNEAARALYGKLGFAEIGRRPSYYRRGAGAVAGAIVLARALDRPDD